MTTTNSTAGISQPPQDLLAEGSVIGAALLNQEALAAAVDQGLTADDFYRPANGHIWSAMVALAAKGDPVDPVTVSSELENSGLLDAIGGTDTLFNLQVGVPSVKSAPA